jgi:uncharacterized membrane protein
MLPEKFLVYFLYFSIMSFAGWLIETAYRSYTEKKFVNAGFLSGPFLPIYGLAALFLAAFSVEARSLPPALAWLITLLSPTVLEYSGSWVMERTFELKLWDYRNEPLNLNGRICLRYSVIWAALSAAHTLVIQPVIFKRIMILGPYISHFAAGGLFVYFILDINYSVRSVLNFREFQNNILKLIERGHKFTPAFDFKADKLPSEIHRLLKPLNAFRHLRKNFIGKLSVFPEELSKILEDRLKK